MSLLKNHEISYVLNQKTLEVVKTPQVFGGKWNWYFFKVMPKSVEVHWNGCDNVIEHGKAETIKHTYRIEKPTLIGMGHFGMEESEEEGKVVAWHCSLDED